MTYAGLLDQIERRYGVDRHIVMAIWAMESTYGTVFDDPEKVKGTIRSLATLAYSGGRLAKYGRQQLVAALKILDRGDVSLSGMVDPARVQGFLDVASGHWDPSLMFVLGGAVIVAVPGVMLQRRLTRPVLDDRFHLPTKTRIDRPLVVGSAIFGAGWGLAGFCPGPAVSAVSMGVAPVFLFVAAMIVGIIVHDRLVAPRG